MKIVLKILFTIVAIPFAIAGGILLGFIYCFISPVELVSTTICDIWERNEDE